MILNILSFFLSFLLALYITPRMREVALRLNIVDKPDNVLKKHKEPVPYMGGMAIYISFIITLALTFDFGKEVLALLLGGSIVFITGLIDDFKVLNPDLKLFGEGLAILALMKAGIMIKLTFVPLWISIPVSFFWLLGITNAFNLIDIMDGLSGGVAFVICTYLFLVAAINGRIMIAIMTLSLGGSILGFLKLNFYPAKIYLGDAGSLFIGLMLGALAMIGTYTNKNVVSALAPVLIFAVPIFDTIFVSYVRFRRGRSIFLGSNDHFALRLKKLELTPVQIMLLSCCITICLGGVGVWMIHLTNLEAAILFSVAVLFLLFMAFLLTKIDIEEV